MKTLIVGAALLAVLSYTSVNVQSVDAATAIGVVVGIILGYLLFGNRKEKAL